MEEKIKYQITYPDSASGFPINVEKLPEDLKNSLDTEYINKLLHYNPDKELYFVDVVYFRKVKKFRKGITEFNINDEIIFGI